MEQDIRMRKGVIKTTIPEDTCKGCPALFGELAFLLIALSKRDLDQQELSATVFCRATTKRRQRHISIMLETNDGSINSDSDIRNWGGKKSPLW